MLIQICGDTLDLGLQANLIQLQLYMMDKKYEV